MMHGYGQSGYGRYPSYSGFGAVGFGDVASDAQTIYTQLKGGDSPGVSSALAAIATSQGAAYAQQVCQQMGQLAMADDVAAAGSTSQVAYTNQNAVIAACTAAGVQTGVVQTTTAAQLFQQLQQGQSQAVVTALMAMDATSRANACQQMGQIAMQADVTAAETSGVAAYTNQNAVIGACTAAGVAMPPPGTTPAPGTTPSKAAMSTASILMLGVVGAGILYYVFK